MIQRVLIKKIRASAKKFPVVSITGPRQSGKTTLAKLCFPGYDYANLEKPAERLQAEQDPEGFLSKHKKGLIIDEAQHVPHLFSYIQALSDESGKQGEYILTGSQNFLLLEKITQTLAGRVSIYNLLPLSIAELQASRKISADYEKYIVNGFYPRIYDKKIHPAELYASYILTYVEREVRQIVNIQNLGHFQLFLKLCAGRTGQIINYAAISNEVGVDLKTIKSWLSVLEASYIIFSLQPHYRNFNKRLVKSPKLYFYDTGLACALLGINNTEQLDAHHHKGALFENMIIADIIKNIFNKGQRPSVYFWRDNTGHEIDCLVEDGVAVKAIEIKSGRTINRDFFNGLDFYKKISKGKNVSSYLIYGGNDNKSILGTRILGWKYTGEIV